MRQGWTLTQNRDNSLRILDADAILGVTRNVNEEKPMRYGKDDEDIHESMQLSRYQRKYMGGYQYQKKRHAGENRLKHRDRDNKTGKFTR